MKRLVIITFMLFISIPVLQANELVIGVKPTPPFVNVDKDKNISGFSIDLITTIVSLLPTSPKIKYHIDPDMGTHLDSVIKNNIDLGIAATTITSKREEILDFSHPFYQADLAILVPKRESTGFEIFLGIIS